MLFEGVKLMVVGMTTVMLFLCLMILCINLVAFLTRGSAAREVEAIAAERALQMLKRNKPEEAPPKSAEEVIAVITAAVAAYENERFARPSL